MKFIMHCEPEDAEALAKLIVGEIPTFERSCRGVGWGWHFGLPNGRTYFLRQIKNGISAVECKRDNP